MDNQTTINLLPAIIERKLELALAGSKFSFKDFEISHGIKSSDAGDVIAQKLCSATSDRALQLWNAFDATSQYELAYTDAGTFNLDLVQKLNIRGDLLHKAFVTIHAKSIFMLDAAPLSSLLYTQAFTILQSELLSTCKQLASKSCGHERLAEFLGSFDIEVIAAIIRHEIARYYIDEMGTHLSIDQKGNEKDTTAKEQNDIIRDDEFDMIDGETDEEDMVADDEIAMMCEKQNYLRPGYSLEETERGYRLLEHSEMDYDNPELFDEPDTLRQFVEAFEKGDTLPATLELTHWLQLNASEIFADVRNMLVFLAEERGVLIWDRSNPLEEERVNTEENAKEAKKETLESLFTSNTPTEQRTGEESMNGQSLIIEYDEKEWRRLVRLYTIHHPARRNFIPVDEEILSSEAMSVASILQDTGIETRKLQTFEQLKNAIWKAVGFTAFKKWLDQQPNAIRLIDSSGKKELFGGMNFLNGSAFKGNLTILHNSLERSRYAVSKLYGWFSLVKIFWNLTDQNSRFSRLASIKDDMLVWEENITCCTLIIQATLGVGKLSFSLEDLSHFCEACRNPQWPEMMKKSFGTLAEQNDAQSAIPMFHEYIDFLSEKSKNLFRVAEDVKISSKAESDAVEKVWDLVEDHRAMVTIEDEDPELVKLLFYGAIAEINEVARYREEACQYLDHRLPVTGYSDEE